jgi:hypothetical protein
LVVDLRLGGSVHTTANAAGDALTLSRSDGSTVWTYSGLEVFDTSGRSLPTHLAVQRSGGHDDLVIQVNDVGARYPLTIDPFVQQAKLTASDGAGGYQLGTSVAISSDGSTVVAGAPNAKVGANNAQGAVYVFVKPTMGWADAIQTAKLTALNGAAGQFLGYSVAMSNDGSTVVAAGIVGGVPGVYVFAKPSAGWGNTTETAKLTASDGITRTDFSARYSTTGGATCPCPRRTTSPTSAPACT